MEAAQATNAYYERRHFHPRLTQEIFMVMYRWPAAAALCLVASCSSSAGPFPPLDAAFLDASSIAGDAGVPSGDLAVPTFVPAPMPTAVGSAAIAVGLDGTVYLAGGVDRAIVRRLVQSYQPATNRWLILPQLKVARNGAAAAVASDGRLYVFGGRDSDQNAISSVEVYTPGAKDWVMGPALSSGRSGLGGVAGSDGRIYAIGGITDVAKVLISDEVEMLDPKGGNWTKAPSLGTPRYALAVARGADDRIYAIAGINEVGAYLDTVEAFSPGARSWSPIASLGGGARAASGAATGRDGRIYIVGGAIVRAMQAVSIATAEVFDPKADNWSIITALPTPVVTPAAAGAADGRIYVFGGRTASEFLNVVQAYSPATLTWVP